MRVPSVVLLFSLVIAGAGVSWAACTDMEPKESSQTVHTSPQVQCGEVLCPLTSVEFFFYTCEHDEGSGTDCEENKVLAVRKETTTYICQPEPCTPVVVQQIRKVGTLTTLCP